MSQAGDEDPGSVTLASRAPQPQGYGELSQSRSAVIAAVAIIFSIDALDLLLLAIGGQAPISPVGLVLSILFDVFLGVQTLRGRKWAKNWMLVRWIVGAVLFGGIALSQGHVAGSLMNVGVVLALIVLLTGATTQLRVVGGSALACLSVFAWVAWLFFIPLALLPTLPETPIPPSFTSYQSAGFFSISYPPNWQVDDSLIQPAQQGMEQYAQSLGAQDQVKDVQVVFVAWAPIQGGDTAIIQVSVEPGSSWPLYSLVESGRQWAKDNMPGFVEYSRARTTIGGKEALISISEFVPESGPFKSTEAYVKGSKFIWTVTAGCGSQNFGANSEVLDEMVRSLRIDY